MPPRRPATFRQADLQRALRAAKAAGIEIERIVVDPANGTFTLIVRGEADCAAPETALDNWLATRARTS